MPLRNLMHLIANKCCQRKNGKEKRFFLIFSLFGIGNISRDIRLFHVFAIPRVPKLIFSNGMLLLL